MISFFVRGRPVPQGSKQYFVNRYTGRAQGREANPKTASWRADVRAKAEEEMMFSQLITGGVKVSIKFVFDRPRSHFGSGKNCLVLRHDAPKKHIQKPDADKLARAVLDAITSVIIADDQRVHTLCVKKRWANTPDHVGAFIVVEEKDEEEEDE